MDSTSKQFYDLDEIEGLAKRKLPKPVLATCLQHHQGHVQAVVLLFMNLRSSLVLCNLRPHGSSVACIVMHKQLYLSQ